MNKVKLGEICTFQSGGTPSRKTDEFYHGTIPWITTVSLNGGHIDENNAIEWITERAIDESAAKTVPINSIMVGTRVGVGKVAINDVVMSTNQDIISLLNIDESIWDKEFICKFIQSQSRLLNSQARGATIKGIKIAILSDLVLPDISIAQQRKISSIIDIVSNVIKRHETQLSLLDELIKSRFVEMFGDMILNPKNWKKKELGTLCDVRDGTHDSPVYYSEGYPLVTSKNITNGTLDFSGCNLICEEDYQKINYRSKVDVGDIIMPMIGTIGKPIIVNTNKPFAIKNVALIKFGQGSKVINTYIRYILQSDYFDRVVIDKIRGGTQKFIALGDIRRLMVCVPQIELQNQFDDFVTKVEQQKATVQKSIDRLETLKKSLMQEYFG